MLIFAAMFRYLMLSFMLAAVSCKSPEATASRSEPETPATEKDDAISGRAEAPVNSQIQGVFLGPIDSGSDRHNQAEVIVKKLLVRGYDYHGQFLEGDTVTVTFQQGFKHRDEEYLKTLRIGDRFKAELIQNESRLSVYNYEKL